MPLSVGKRDPNRMQFADASVTDQFTGLTKSVVGALLRASLQNHVVLPHRLDQLLAFGDGVCQRLLQIHILASLGSGDRDQSVPMVGRRDRYAINVVTRKQLAIVVDISRSSGRGRSVKFSA